MKKINLMIFSLITINFVIAGSDVTLFVNNTKGTHSFTIKTINSSCWYPNDLMNNTLSQGQVGTYQSQIDDSFPSCYFGDYYSEKFSITDDQNANNYYNMTIAGGNEGFDSLNRFALTYSVNGEIFSTSLDGVDNGTLKKGSFSSFGKKYCVSIYINNQNRVDSSDTTVDKCS